MAEGNLYIEEELNKMLQCSICSSELSRPKQLPCLHIFCLDCLKKHAKKSTIDYKPACPLCKKEFNPPQGEVELLPSNELVMRLILENRLREEKPELATYELCSETGSGTKLIAEADRAMSNDEQKPKEELIRIYPSYCCKHKDKEIELYCCDCNSLICLLCHAADHSKHICKVPQEVAEERKKMIQKDIEAIRQCYNEAKGKFDKLSEERDNVLQQKSDTESDVRKSTGDIQRLLEIHEDEMMEKLGMMWKNKIKAIEVRQNDAELRHTYLTNFLNDSRMTVQRGTDCEVIKAAGDLRNRAQEFIKAGDEQKSKASMLHKCMEVISKYTPSVTNINKLVGGIYSIGDQSTSSPGTGTVSFLLHRKSVSGVTVVDSEIFVIREGQSLVNVYDKQSLKESREIKIPDFKLPLGIAGCAYNRALYIGDARSKCSLVHRVDLTNDSVTRWTIKKYCEPWDLSVTAEHTVLVTICFVEAGCGNCRVFEYTTEGQLMREIVFDASIENAWQTVQLSSDQFIVSHGHCSCPNRVCLVNSEGQIIKSYGDGIVEWLRVPISLAINLSHNSEPVLFVVDGGNNRVLKLDTDLTYLGQVNAPRDLKKPYRCCFDSSTEQLILGEESGRIVIFNSK